MIPLLCALLAADDSFVTPRPGSRAEYQIVVSLATRSGDDKHDLRGRADVSLYCVSQDESGSHWVMSIRSADFGGTNGLRDSMAYLLLDQAGRVLPDLPKGTKLSLDPSSWTAPGLIVRLPTDRFGGFGAWTEAVDLQIYGEAQTLDLTHRLAALPGDGWEFTRQSKSDVPLRIGRQSQPILRTYWDHWKLDVLGTPVEWNHKTAIDYRVPGKPALSVVLEMSAKRRDHGKLSDVAAAALREDAAWLKPIWTALVNPEPHDLGRLDVNRLAGSLDDFVRSRSTSKLFTAAKVLSANMGRLREQIAAVKTEDIDAGNLVGKQAPDFTLTTAAGKRMRISDLKGKAVLLVFWGLGCRLCRTEAPLLTELNAKYFDRGFEVIAVESFDTDEADVRAYLAENKLRHTVLTKGAEVAGRKYFISGLPRAYWIDREGRIAGRQSTFESLDELAAKVEPLLRGPDARRP